ncbi:T9SS type A sorting domain-containing protein [Siphonobacter sp. SORGH_AS_1065]|uniref:T9SS type A sorting domain-containing protein n=1 Tax=Siphonobacter sp. SORGH_AS_1065 TaxID=3041795 RepID=UPI002780132B|nr:T9SS type A sorting domain-containing protein [Siphonobacter sp. SORGH_AS_1065]MDQ1088800.1 hypothetical protein [Siphonobacter sp. SORGH_AS_1065]
MKTIDLNVLPSSLLRIQTLVVAILGLLTPFGGFSQTCETPSFQASTANGVINWQKFPDFTLPFTIVYSGPRLNDSQQTPLRKGFSHLANFNEYDGSLPRANRAILWYGTATGINQPWDVIRSPWGNNLSTYRSKWANEMRSFANLFSDSHGKAMPDVDILMADIERHYNTNDSILSLKRRNLVPAVYTQLSDEAFLTRYHRDMQNLYAAPFQYMRENGLPASTRLTSYSDSPIRNTFLNIDGNSWQDWLTNPERVHFLTKDSVTNTVGGSFYNRQDFLLPSAYYIYDYPNPYAGNYLAYLLFQVEANKAWSSKDVVPIVWLRYTSTNINKPIQTWMAEATAIFPFFSGAKGLWLWESPGNTGTNETLANYEYFTQGLYRLSQFKDFFNGGLIYVPKSARDHFADQDAIWRGVVKGNQILVAAHNPFATENASTPMTIRYGNWQQEITLRGREIMLCAFDLPESALHVIDIKPYPNPASASLTIDVFTSEDRDVNLQLFSVTGQIVHQQTIMAKTGNNPVSLHTHNLAPGMYLVKVGDGSKSVTKRVLIRK